MNQINISNLITSRPQNRSSLFSRFRLRFDYVLTTFACTDLPHFAVFGGKCVNDRIGGRKCKMAQNVAKYTENGGEI